MKHPILALIWQSWRLSRRWYLLVLVISTYLGWILLNLKSPTFIEPRDYQLFSANPVFIMIFGLACFCTLLAISIGNKSGFPFSFEYRLPVSTFTLVTVPMIFLGVLCASLYFIPLGIYRLILDIPFPLLPGAALLINAVLVLLCCSWITSNNSSRFITITFGCVFIIMLFNWFKPLNIIFSSNFRSGNSDSLFNTDIIFLESFEYMVLIFISFLLIGITVAMIAKKRNGEPAHILLGGNPGTRLSTTNAGTIRKLFSVSALVDYLADKLSVACPTTQAWQAEIWLEFKRYVFPILLFSITIAVLIPLLTLFGTAVKSPMIVDITAITPLIIYFTGIGLSLINRRQAFGGYMNVFEGSRAMSTLQLASIQILSIAIATGIGIALVKGSLSFSLPYANELGGAYIYLDSFSLLAPITNPTLLMTLNNQAIGFCIYASIITLFFCLHSCSVFWGRKFPIMTLLIACYALTMISQIRNDQSGIQTIINLMWGFSFFVSLITLIVMVRLYCLKIISIKAGIILLLGCLMFFVCAYFNLEQRGYNFSQMSSELLALNISLLLLPLMFTVLTLWCYDRLRHT